MKEQIVSFELAKLAKEKGFREPCSHYYFADGEFKEHEVIKDGGYYGGDYSISLESFNEDWNNRFVTTKDGDRCFGCNNNKDYFETFSAPTQSLLQKWLREKHNMEVLVTCNASGWFWEINKAYPNNGGTFIAWSGDNGPNDAGHWETYEEALETGLEQALKLIYNGDKNKV